jgi:hypothetical protein
MKKLVFLLLFVLLSSNIIEALPAEKQSLTTTVDFAKKKELVAAFQKNGLKANFAQKKHQFLALKQYKKALKLNEEPENHRLAIFSFGLGILSLVLTVMSALWLFALLSAAGTTVLTVGAFAVLLLTVLSGLLATIFGVIALKKIKANPEKFKGKKYAIIGIICTIPIALLVLRFFIIPILA